MKKVISIFIVLSFVCAIDSLAASTNWNLQIESNYEANTSGVYKTTSYKNIGISTSSPARQQIYVFRNTGQRVGGPYTVNSDDSYVFRNLSINTGDRIHLRIYNANPYSVISKGSFNADHTGELYKK